MYMYEGINAFDALTFCLNAIYIVLVLLPAFLGGGGEGEAPLPGVTAPLVLLPLMYL